MDWSVVGRLWEKWAPNNVGSSGYPLKAALLINYDPTGPSRLVSTIKGRGEHEQAAMSNPAANTTQVPLGNDYQVFVSGCHLSTNAEISWESMCLYITDGSAEQEGIKADPIEISQFISFVKRNKLQKESFFIGPNEYLVTSIHESWFCARCLNTSKQAGEGAIVMHTSAFLLVGLYEGSVGAASRAMVAVDQLSGPLNRRNL